MTWLLAEVQREHGMDLSAEPLALQRLKEAAEKAKIELSTLRAAEIHLPFLAAGPDGPLHLVTTLTRAKFEGLVAPLVAATAVPCQQALADAELTPADIDAVLLVGGQTRMPLVQALVEEVFGQAPSRAVNPDEVVALGAAIQGAALGGQGRDVLLLDVTPLTLGVETQGGTVAPLIPRNTPLPVQRSEVFTTAADDQATVEVHVVQGERSVAAENKSLARFALEGLGPGPRGAVQIAVAFTLDANGILQVSATDRASGQVRAVTVQPASGLGEAEVARMVAEAARYRAQDAAREALIAARNGADALLGQVARLGAAAGTTLDAAALEELGVLAAGLEAALPTGDSAQILERTAHLRAALDALRLEKAS
jgi:molecular chaperone DnaK